MLKKIYLFVVTALLLAFGANAQVTTSGITGIVKDNTGNSLEGATITALHEPSGTVYTTSTRTGGLFDLQGLRIGGPYRLTTTYTGYEPKEINNISLQLGEIYQLTIDMSQHGQELEGIVVTSRSKQVNTVKTGAGNVVTSEQLRTMPTISRSITDFTRATPQANGNSFAGRDGRYNNLKVDGANLNNSFGLSSELAPGGGNPIALDAFDQISVNIAPFDVRQSGFTGAGINAVTKSGTNNFHGSIYGYVRNQNFNGYKVNGVQLSKTPSNNSIVGATLGGPIIKNKLFFFASAEWEKKSRPGITFVANGSKNTGTPSSTPLDSLAKVYNFVKSKYGYDLGAYDNFPNFDESNHKILGKLDWNITNNHKLTFKYSDFKGYEVSPANGSSLPQNGPIVVTGQPKGVARLPNNRFSANSMAFNSSNYATNRIVKSATLELNSRFNTAMSNQFLATFTRISDVREPYGNKTVFPTVDIFNGAGQNYISLGTDPFTNNNQLKNDVLSFTDNFTYYLHRHTITAGLSLEKQKVGNMFMGGSQGHYAFNTLDDFINERAPAYYGYTYSLVEGQPAVFSAELKMSQVGLYAQDEFNVNNFLKLTYGLRIDMPIYGENPIANPKINTLSLPDRNGNLINYNTGAWPKNKPLFSPRIGFNWDALKDKSLIVRGGTGIFSGRIPFVFLTNMPSGSGMYQNSVRINNAADLAKYGITKFDPNPNAYSNSAAFPKTAGTTVPQSFVVIDPNFKFPQVWRTNIGADKKFGDGFTATVDIMYTKDLNAVAMRNPNIIAATQQLSGLDNRFFYHNGLDSSMLYYHPKSADPNHKLDLGTPIVLENTKKGNSLSVTGQLSKEFRNGISSMIAYTYTRAKEVSSNPGSRASSAWQSINNVNGPNANVLDNSQYAIPHRVIANLAYRIDHGIFDFPTTLSLFYEGTYQSMISYNINGSIVGDGNTELMYVYAKGTDVPFVATTKYTIAQQQAAYDAFISSSKYLSNNKNKYVSRYGATSPWYNQIDFRLLQDILIRRNENGRINRGLQFSLDIFNIGNLLGNKWKNWGYRQMTTVTDPLILKAVVKDANGNYAPTYNLKEFNSKLIDNVYTPNLTMSSTWYMQMGLKFNF